MVSGRDRWAVMCVCGEWVVLVSGRDRDGIQVCVCTVEPPLSGPPFFGTARLSGMTTLSLKMFSNNGRVVSADVTMDTGMCIFCACADAHIHC